MKSSQIRQTFIDFFKQRGHQFVPSSPVVPQNDPTLLFINAGMNQFKDVFLGLGTRSYSKAVNSQVCIRVSGKHNDLEDVGKDGTHLTLFEMLGNWSFGDYYKKESITWAWELLTQVFQFPKDKLYATVFKDDDESETLWKTETDIAHNRIYRCDAKDNFWEMGETGPCGPCSEIHIDLGEAACGLRDKPGHKCVVNGDCQRYVELWNLVFIQYNRLEDGSFEDLPKKNVDTGAGLERLTAYLQGVLSVYETDLFTPIIKKIEHITGKSYSPGPEGMPHRVLSDHVRTLCFAISDNVRPSNEGRGYVLRRLLRRALRYAKKLDIHDPILYQLVDPVVETLGMHFDALSKRKDYIKSMIKAEEEAFLRTLEGGIAVFETIITQIKHGNTDVLPGKEAFKLYDTFGFPLDLTQLMAEERGLKVDTSGFHQALELQRKRSRKAIKKQVFEAEAPIGGEARLVKHDDDRIKMARHHTVTHLLHAALREVLGMHVTQAGSLVDLDRLRFDFTHPKALSKQEIDQVENIVNQKINQAIPVTFKVLPIKEAKAEGAMALFGEKYEDMVRVVEIGGCSKELCGGNHVSNTAEIEAFKLIKESAISAGVRRIEAVAGNENIDHYFEKQRDRIIMQIKPRMEQFKKLAQEIALLNQPVDLPDEFRQIDTLDLSGLETLEKSLFERVKQLEKTLNQLKSQHAGKKVEELLEKAVDLPRASYRLLTAKLGDYDLSMLKSLADELTNANSNIVVVLASEKQGKGFFLVKLGSSVDTGVINAQDLIKTLTGIAGGGGGGRPNMAQAGGAESRLLSKALEAVKKDLD
ncbi:alanine--tRNA ligase [Thermoproteota archaeon]